MLKKYFARPDVQTGILCLVILLLVSLISFAPLLTGKELPQGDVLQARGMQADIQRFRETHGEEPYWTENAFSGMPAETVGISYPQNVMQAVHRLLNGGLGLPYPIVHLFLGMSLFFGLLRATGIRPWLALAGALGFGFFSYHPMIIEAGHTNKFMVLMTCPGVLWGIILLYRSRLIGGFLLLFATLGLNLYYNHVQMSYYLFFVIGCVVVYQLVQAAVSRTWRRFAVATGLLVAGVAGALLLNAAPLYPMYEYSKYTVRGKNELAEASATPAADAPADGMSRENAYRWSHGRGELISMLIPGAYGFSSGGSLPKDGATVQALRGMGQLPAAPEELVGQLPGYWGGQPFTSGPYYLGAVIVLLAVVGLALGRTGLKYALLYSILLSLVLALGSNSLSVMGALLLLALPLVFVLTQSRVQLPSPLYGSLLAIVALLILAFDPGGYTIKDLFFDYLPFYSKFRVPSSMLIIASLATPWLALIGAERLLDASIPAQNRLRALYYALGWVGGVCLVLLVAGSAFFDFRAEVDEQLETQVGPLLTSAIRQDRSSLLTADAFRSLALVLAVAGLVWLTIRNTLKAAAFGILLVVLVLADMLPIQFRIIPRETYQRKSLIEQQLQARETDLVISRDTSAYRVFPITRGAFSDGYTPAFEPSIGGYNAAILRRYDQVRNRYLSDGIGNPNVINMLNAKYLIINQDINVPWLMNLYQARDGERIYLNKTAYGPAWFVQNVNVVPTPQAAFDTLGTTFSLETAIVEASQQAQLTAFDTTAVNRDAETIQVLNKDNNLRVYRTQSPNARFATFSEVYYAPGWTATIDGQPAPIIRTNFILRGLVIPAGEHTVTFRYEPQYIYTATTISKVMSGLLGVLVMAGLFMAWRRRDQPQVEDAPVA